MITGQNQATTAGSNRHTYAGVAETLGGGGGGGGRWRVGWNPCDGK